MLPDDTNGSTVRHVQLESCIVVVIKRLIRYLRACLIRINRNERSEYEDAMILETHVVIGISLSSCPSIDTTV